VFPDGRTVHVPSDGKPLSGYAVALADVERRGGSPSAAHNNGVETGKTNFFAKLLGFGKNKTDEEIEPDTPAAQMKVAEAAPKPKQLGVWRRVPGVAADEASPKAEANPETARAEPALPGLAVPLPKDRPSNYQLAATALPERLARPASSAAHPPNDIFSARGFWAGLPVAESSEVSGARRRPIETASADPGATGSIGPFATPEYKDRVAPETALAYAAQPGLTQSASRAAPTSPTIPRTTAVATSVALKRSDAVTSQSLGEIAAALPPVPARPGQRYDDPWIRATAMTPSVERFMNTMLFGMPDFRNLQPLLAQPTSVIVMTFSGDPHLGMTTAQFSGPAVVFVATATFSNRSAALR
jgi:hypothetical protein